MPELCLYLAETQVWPQTFHLFFPIPPLLGVRRGHIISSGRQPWDLHTPELKHRKAGVHIAVGTEGRSVLRWQGHRSEQPESSLAACSRPGPQMLCEWDVSPCYVKLLRPRGCLCDWSLTHTILIRQSFHVGIAAYLIFLNNSTHMSKLTGHSYWWTFRLLLVLLLLSLL